MKTESPLAIFRERAFLYGEPVQKRSQELRRWITSVVGGRQQGLARAAQDEISSDHYDNERDS